MGLDPGSPGSRPGLQAALNHCATRAAHLYFLRFIYSWETQRESRDIGRSRCLTESPMWDSIPELWDHALSWRQTLNRWATQASQNLYFNKIPRGSACTLKFVKYCFGTIDGFQPWLYVGVVQETFKLCSSYPGDSDLPGLGWDLSIAKFQKPSTKFSNS